MIFITQHVDILDIVVSMWYDFVIPFLCTECGIRYRNVYMRIHTKYDFLYHDNIVHDSCLSLLMKQCQSRIRIKLPINWVGHSASPTLPHRHANPNWWWLSAMYSMLLPPTALESVMYCKAELD